ncbi:MAG: AI-2E family transporter [Eubacterium sp.]|nr:AI-2E family transporter [Eubacterium sp.]
MKTRYGIMALTILLIFLSFRFLLPLVLPFVLAFLFAKAISPIIHFFTKKLHWNHKVSVILVVVITIAALVGFLFYVGSIVIGQLISLIQKVPVYQQMASQTVENLCCQCDRVFDWAKGTSYAFVETQTMKLQNEIGNNLVPRMSGYAAQVFQWVTKAGAGLFIFFLSTLLILLDDSFPRVRGKMRKITSKLKTAGLAYIKAQIIIIFIIAVIMSLGLMIMKNEYALLFGIGIAAFDAFPVVGSGIVLIPWAVLQIIGGNYFHAAILVTLFVIASFLREILEPKLFGKEIGMKPLFVLIAVYAGVELFGMSGIILGPVALSIINAVDEVVKETVS